MATTSGTTTEPFSPSVSSHDRISVLDPPTPSQPARSAEPSRAEVTSLDAALDVIRCVEQRCASQVLGRDDVIELVCIALLADGHVLLEDFPGSGKTTLAKALGDSLIDDNPNDKIEAMRRIQFTPDMLPSDITGTTIFDPNTNDFFFRPGPLFAHVVLADEINRTSPKVQSALLEAMGEKQVTVDNVTRALDELFFVIATQNPLDLAGTFPLPNAQLDRFLFKIRMVHVERDAELTILKTMRARRAGVPNELRRVSRNELIQARRIVEESIYVAPEIQAALVDIARQTREDDRVTLGASTRSLVLAIPALQVHALMKRRDYVTADDVERLAPEIFAHRVELSPGVDDAAEVIRDCCARPLEELARGTYRASTRTEESDVR